jgi:glutamate racemase
MGKKNNPIGIFDSGVGGLTVAHALHSLLPREQMIYFGDTLHLPYGDKSRETIISYSLGITDFLLLQDCKVILIACNSASSNAWEEVREHVGDRALVMNVIDPVVEQVCADRNVVRTVGVIGTKATIDSGTYEKRILECAPHLEVSSMATPLFVPMIEEGFVFDDISNAIIRSYLSRKELEEIDTLILGCTHYPIIRNQISRFFNFEVNVMDTAMIVAGKVRELLARNDLVAAERTGPDRFLVSDQTPYFGVIAGMFFSEPINLEKKNIWVR